MFLVAAVADKVAHGLDDAEDRNFQSLKHRNRFAHIQERNLLRRCNDDGTGDRSSLREC